MAPLGGAKGDGQRRCEGSGSVPPLLDNSSCRIYMIYSDHGSCSTIPSGHLSVSNMQSESIDTDKVICKLDSRYIGVSIFEVYHYELFVGIDGHHER